MLIINANIVSMAGNDYKNGYIYIKDGKIAKIGDMAGIKITDDHDIIDVKGKTAYPGFIDAHSHIGLFENGLGFEGDDGNEDTDPVTPQLRALDAINTFDLCFSEARQAGVTSVVVAPGSSNPIAGSVCALKTDGVIIDEMIIKAPIAMKFALGENPKISFHSKSQAPSTRMATASLIRENLEKAKKYMQLKEDAQNDDDCDEPEYDAKCEALIPLLKGEIKAHIHAHRADDILTAIRICNEFSLDYVLIHCTDGHLLADTLARQNAKVICGPIIGTRCKPELINATYKNPAVLNKNGVRLAISTDHPELPVDMLAVSAGLAVREGLPFDEAIKAITIDAAKICDIDDRVGSLEAGKDADIAVFAQNPLTIEAKPDVVIINGKVAVKR